MTVQTSATDALPIGRGCLTGTPFSWCLRDGHVVIEGLSNGGKTTLLARWLTHLAGAPDVVVAGSDMTGRMVGPAWDGSRHRHWQVGTSAFSWNLEAHAVLLESIVTLVETRTAEGDLPPTVERPLVVVVFDEFASLLRFAASPFARFVSGAREDVRERIIASYLRILADAHRATVRVVTVSHSSLEETYPRGYGREYAALRVSFRSKADALSALHGPVDRDLAAAHEQAPSGAAVVSVPGGPVMRLRTEDFPGGEDVYIAQIRATLAAQREDSPS